MNKNTKFDKIDTLLNRIHKVEPSEFLLSRIHTQTEYIKESEISINRVYSALIAFSFLFFVNLWTIQQCSNNESDISELVEEMDILSNKNPYGDS